MSSKLPPDVRAAWINCEYASSMNETQPTLNAGRVPYFVATQSTYSGQWVRVVIEPRRGRSFWCVGEVASVVDDDTIAFHRLEYENGASREPSMFRVGAWKGIARRNDQGGWDIVELAPERPPPHMREVRCELVHPDGRAWSIEAGHGRVTVIITMPDGERVERTRKEADAAAEADRLIAEQLADGFARR